MQIYSWMEDLQGKHSPQDHHKDHTVCLRDGGLHALMTVDGKCHRFFTATAPIAPPQPMESRAR